MEGGLRCRWKIHYPGDAAWKRFHRIAVRNPLSGEVLDDDSLPVAGELTDAGREILEVAVAFYGMVWVRQWVDVNLPELEGEKPKTCICESGNTDLRNRIRVHLMRQLNSLNQHTWEILMPPL